MIFHGLRIKLKPLGISSILGPYIPLGFILNHLNKNTLTLTISHHILPSAWTGLPAPLTTQHHSSLFGYGLRHSLALSSPCSFPQQSQPSELSEVIQQSIYSPHICQLSSAKLHCHHEPTCEICISYILKAWIIFPSSFNSLQPLPSYHGSFIIIKYFITLLWNTLKQSGWIID